MVKVLAAAFLPLPLLARPGYLRQSVIVNYMDGLLAVRISSLVLHRRVAALSLDGALGSVLLL